MCVLCDFHLLKKLQGALIAFFTLIISAEIHCQGDIFQYAELIQQFEGLVYDADMLPSPGIALIFCQGVDGCSLHDDGAAGEVINPRDHVHQG